MLPASSSRRRYRWRLRSPQNFHILVAGLSQIGGFNRHRQAGNAGHAPRRSSFRSLVDRALSRRRRRALPGAVQHHAHPLREPDRPGQRPCCRTRINSRLNIAGATPDDGESVWAESRQTPFQTVDGAPALTTTYFGADYRLGSDLLLGAMVQRDDRIVTLPIDVELTATDAYLPVPMQPIGCPQISSLAAGGLRGNLRWPGRLLSEETDFTTEPSADRGAAERQLGLGRMAADACGRRHPCG